MTDAQPLPRLDMGRVVRRMLGVTASNFPAFLTLTFLFYTLPSYGLGLVADYALRPLLVQNMNNQMLVFLVGYAGASFTGIPSFIAAGVITYGALQTFNGGRLKLGECLALGVRKFLPLALVGSCAAVVTLAGLALLIIPGFIAGAAFFLAAASLAVENLGVLEAFRRSVALTSNNRWRIFWLVIAGSVIGIGVMFAVSQAYVVLLEAYYASPDPLNTAEDSSELLRWAAFGLYMILQLMTALFSSTLVASVYFEVRTLKEGVFSNALAKVFD